MKTFFILLALLLNLSLFAQTNPVVTPFTNTIVSSYTSNVVSYIAVTNRQRFYWTNHPVGFRSRGVLLPPAIGAAILSRIPSAVPLTTNTVRSFVCIWTVTNGQTGWLVQPNVTTNAP